MLAVLACGVSTNAALLNPTVHYAKTCPAAVLLYTTAEHVEGAYREVALLSSSGDADATSEDDMYQSQRKTAAELGANGIIVGSIQEPNPNVLGVLLGIGVDRKGRALAIFVPSDSVRTVNLCNQTPLTKPPPRLSDGVPSGTLFIADAKSKVYFPLDCPAVAFIPEAQRLYYQNEITLAKSGYVRSDQC